MPERFFDSPTLEIKKALEHRGATGTRFEEVQPGALDTARLGWPGPVNGRPCARVLEIASWPPCSLHPPRPTRLALARARLLTGRAIG